MRALALALTFLFVPSVAASKPFEKVWCLRYAFAPDVAASTFLAGVAADETMDAPFAMCVAQRGEDVVDEPAHLVLPPTRPGPDLRRAVEDQIGRAHV